MVRPIAVSERQAELAQKCVVDAGLEDEVEIRLQDYREIEDGPFDAISSIGMIEHVGAAQLGSYFARLYTLLRPGGRLLNHGISEPFAGPASFEDNSFSNRYIFPDGELPEVGAIVSVLHRTTFEVRHLESLREHYALTLRRWVGNLEANWNEAVAHVGNGRARTWLLYMAAAALGFETNRNQIYQVLAVRPDGSRSGMPLRPRFE